MLRLVFTLLLLLCSFAPYAQKKGSLAVVVHDDKWMVEHTVTPGETIFLLSRKYHAPPAVIAEINSIGYESGLTGGSIVYIPIGAYNYLAQAPLTVNEAKALYYKVGDNDNLGRVSRRSGVSQRIIQELNDLPDNNIIPGRVLQIGWVKYDATPVQNTGDGAIKGMEQKPVPVVKKDSVKFVRKPLDSNSRYKIALVRKEVKQPDGKVVVYLLQDTVWADTLGPGGRVYMQQTANETNVAEEKGTVVFYDMPGKVKSTKAFFALHNTLPKGTAVRVYNPGTGKYIFVKVIGPMPDTKQYHNAILGVSGGARVPLGITEDRAWCELKYAGQ